MDTGITIKTVSMKKMFMPKSSKIYSGSLAVFSEHMTHGFGLAKKLLVANGLNVRVPKLFPTHKNKWVNKLLSMPSTAIYLTTARSDKANLFRIPKDFSFSR